MKPLHRHALKGRSAVPSIGPLEIILIVSLILVLALLFRSARK